MLIYGEIRTRAEAHDYVPDVAVLLFWTVLVTDRRYSGVVLLKRTLCAKPEGGDYAALFKVVLPELK